jgi:hypothetical protein
MNKVMEILVPCYHAVPDDQTAVTIPAARAHKARSRRVQSRAPGKRFRPLRLSEPRYVVRFFGAVVGVIVGGS